MLTECLGWDTSVPRVVLSLLGRLLVDERGEPVGEVPRQRLQQTGGLGERCLQGPGHPGEQFLPRGEIRQRDDVAGSEERLTEGAALQDEVGVRLGDVAQGLRGRGDVAGDEGQAPEILFLDEPTTGLDPGSRRVLWEEIKRLRDTGVTVILTTQYLEEADELADRIAIIDEGLVVAEGTSDELKASIGGDVITFSFETEEDITKAQQVLTDSVQEKMELRITVEDGASKIPGYLKELTTAGIEVSSVSASKPTLDDVFLEVTGYRLEGSEEPVEETPAPTRGRGR